MAERNFLAEMTTKGDPMLKSQRYTNDVRSFVNDVPWIASSSYTFPGLK